MLRCEARRPGGSGMGLWRYSLAALIICAAMIDVVWWVPAQQAQQRARREPAVSAEISRCRQIREKQAEIEKLERQIADLESAGR